MATKDDEYIGEEKSFQMSLTTLFGKLQEYESELERLENHEAQENKLKRFASKTKIKGYDSNKENESQSTSNEDEL